MPAEARHPLRGILFLLAALFLFALLDATAKYLSAFFAVPLLVWARYAVHFAIMLLAVAPGMGWQLVATRRPGLMFLRALMLVGVTLLGQLALQTLPLAETTALVFVTPLLVALLAGPLLGERVRPHAWLATVAGFAGVLLIARPGGTLAGVGIVYALAAALCYAVYQILTRKLSDSEPPLRLLFHTALVGTVAMSLALPALWLAGGTAQWPTQWPDPWQVLLIASLGVHGGAGHFLLIRAFREAPVSSLSPLLYVQLIWATLLGAWLFGHLPDRWAIAGMAIIGAAGLGLFWQGARPRR